MDNNGTGHPVLGIVLGILAALLLTALTGVIGGGIALILGIAAVLIGISAKRKCGKGIGAIVIGALSVVLAIVLTVGTISAMNLMKEEAEKQGYTELAKYMDKPYLGMMGIFTSLPQDEESLNELVDQLNELSGNSTNN